MRRIRLALHHHEHSFLTASVLLAKQLCTAHNDSLYMHQPSQELLFQCPNSAYNVRVEYAASQHKQN